MLDVAERVSVRTSEVGHHLRKLYAGLVQRRASAGRLYYRPAGDWASRLVTLAAVGLLPARGERTAVPGAPNPAE